MNHAYACRKDATGEPTCKRWCGRPDLCLSTLTYPEDYMQSAYEHGLRDGLAHAKTDGRSNNSLEARLAECLGEREARQKHGWGYGQSVSDQWLERDIVALQRMLSKMSEGAEISDCGEAGHAEGRCGNAQCLRGNSYAAPIPDFDSIALETAQEIALMWGRDRTQFVAKIQVAVRAAVQRAQEGRNG